MIHFIQEDIFDIIINNFLNNDKLLDSHKLNIKKNIKIIKIRY